MSDRRKKYAEMREVKQVSFHKERDKDLLMHLNNVDDFSNYIKRKLREELKK